MTSTAIIREMTLRYRAEGAAEYAAAGERVAASSGKAAQGIAAVATVSDTAAPKILSQSVAVERLAKAYDPLYKATANAERAERTLALARAAGEAGTPAYIAAAAGLARARAALASANDNEAKSATAAGAAHNGHAAGMGNAAASGQELVHVLKAVADETAAGVPITRALQVESGRLFQIFTSGGFGGAIASVASKFSALANPLVLGAAGFAGLGYAALTAAQHIAEVRSEMDKAVSGVGAFAGLTGRGLGALADRYSESVTGGRALSRGAAEDVAGSLASTGRLDADNIARAMGLARGYAGAYGTSTSDAGKALGDIFKDPLKGLDTLNERFGFLDAGTRSYVETLVRQGRTQEAVRAAIDAASASLNTFAAPQGPWDRFTSWWAKRNAEVEQGIAGAAGLLPRDPLDAYREDARSSGFGMLNIMKAHDYTANTYAEDVRFRAMLSGNSPMMLEQARNVATGRDSLTASDIAGRVAPEVDALRNLRADRDRLASVLGDPEVVRRLGEQAGVAFAALDKLNVGVATFATAADKVRQQTAFSVALIGADDIATRTLIETQKVYATTLQATRDATQAAAEAEKVRAEAVANAQKRLDDAEQNARDQAKLIGLNPYQRLLEEERQAIEKLRRDNVIPSGGMTLGRPGVGIPLGGGFDTAVNRTLGFEGGLLPADTNGTPSKFGINAANNPGVDLSTLTVDQAKGIYRTKYWDPLHLDGASAGLQRVAFDTSVMEGPARANRFIRESGGDADQFMDLREKFEAGLLASDPGKYGRFATSWANRDAALRLDLGKAGTMEGVPGASSVTDATKSEAATRALTSRKAGEMFAAPLREAGQTLDAMERSNKALGAGFDMSADKVAGLNERLKLENDLIRSGATSLAPYGPQLDAIEQRWAAATKATEDHKKQLDQLVGAMDDVRGSAKGFLDPLLSAAIHGTSAMAALHQGLDSLASRIGSKIEDTALDALFGSKGTTGGGLFGGGLGGFLSDATKAATGDGSFLYPYASGGYTGAGSKYQPAGVVHAGEFVFSQEAVSRVGVGSLDSWHRSLRGYADGGYVGSMPAMPSAAQFPAVQGGGDTHIHVQVNGATGNTELHQITHAAVTSALTSYDKALPGRMAERQRRTG